MNIYHNFIGVDIGKFNFVATTYGNKSTKEYENNPSGFKEFLKDFKRFLPQSLIILETTGGYEYQLLLTLCNKKLLVHRANTRKVKNFIKSFSNGAKTDSLDAKALAFYGFERHKSLEIFKPISNNLLEIYGLVQCRKDLKLILVAEKNRLRAPRSIKMVKTCCETIINVLNIEVQKLEEAINLLIENDDELKQRKKILMTIPGIGPIVAFELLAFMPELGSLNGRQIASLAGLAPRANDSGKFKGYRQIGHGRNIIKPSLFLSAMSARNSNSELKTFYESLIDRGKKKKVALTALMRKIIVIANARIRDYLMNKNSLTT